MNEEKQLTLLEHVCPRYRSEYEAFAYEPTSLLTSII